MTDDYFNMAALRSLVVEEGHQWDVYAWSDQRVLEYVGNALTTGQFRLAGGVGTVYSGGASAKPVETEEEERPWPPPEIAQAVKTWIEIELVGEDNEPIPFARFSIAKKDGSVVAAGRLDEFGYAYKGNLDEGNYVVSFPDFDKEAWEKV